MQQNSACDGEDLTVGEIPLYQGFSKMPHIITVEESSSLFMPCCC